VQTIRAGSDDMTATEMHEARDQAVSVLHHTQIATLSHERVIQLSQAMLCRAPRSGVGHCAAAGDALDGGLRASLVTILVTKIGSNIDAGHGQNAVGREERAIVLAPREGRVGARKKKVVIMARGPMEMAIERHKTSFQLSVFSYQHQQFAAIGSRCLWLLLTTDN